MTDRLKENEKNISYMLKTFIFLDFRNIDRHSHVGGLGLLCQEFTASLLPQGQ